MKKEKQTLKRLLKQLGLGVLIGGVLGGILGFFMGYFNIVEKGLPFSQETVINLLVPSLRIIYVLSALVSIFYTMQVKKVYRFYNPDDDSSEDSYRLMNLKYAYALTFLGISIVLSLVSLVLSMGYISNINFAGISLPIIDIVFILVLSTFQIYLLKLYKAIRGIEIPLVPNLKELKNNIMQKDEAELKANYESAFDIVMNLSGAILPTIYFALLILSILSRRVELTGILVAAVIHIYILLMQFKMSKQYYK